MISVCRPLSGRRLRDGQFRNKHAAQGPPSGQRESDTSRRGRVPLRTRVGVSHVAESSRLSPRLPSLQTRKLRPREATRAPELGASSHVGEGVCLCPGVTAAGAASEGLVTLCPQLGPVGRGRGQVGLMGWPGERQSQPGGRPLPPSTLPPTQSPGGWVGAAVLGPAGVDTAGALLLPGRTSLADNMGRTQSPFPAGAWLWFSSKEPLPCTALPAAGFTGRSLPGAGEGPRETPLPRVSLEPCTFCFVFLGTELGFSWAEGWHMDAKWVVMPAAATVG